MREVHTLAQFDALVARGATRMAGWQLQSVDLTGRAEALNRLDPTGALFLGCTLTPEAARDLVDRGGVLFPSLADVPFETFRGDLYSPESLYAGLERGYEHTPDAIVYAWSQGLHTDAGMVHDTLAQALHDTSIDDALEEYVEGRRIVGVMGGHALERGTEEYAEAAHLGRDLAHLGLTVATGGGPGAMEAANLGARLAGADDASLDKALAAVARVPSFRPSVTDWARAAFDAVAGIEPSDLSLGIPTWFYGHEPPNVFATQIAKYFRNAIREDVLLEVSDCAVVYLPGAGGTVQEIFQTACRNYYAADESAVVPMILVGVDYWTTTMPAWPLLEALGAGRPFAHGLFLVADPQEVLGTLLDELRRRDR